jgi:hypothetical protein
VRGRGAFLFAIVVALAWASPVAGETRPLREELSALRARGIRVVWSEALVRDEMRVETPADAAELRPAEVLERLLAPHGLAALEAAPGHWFVVRREEAARVGRLRVAVRDSGGTPVAGVEVRLAGREVVVTTGNDGVAELAELPVGRHRLELRKPGFRIEERNEVEVFADELSTLEVELSLLAPAAEEIVVLPGRTVLGSPALLTTTGLTRAEVRALPHFADEPLRLVHRLPGVAANDVSARFFLRGGEPREVGVRLDGLELDAPFHLEGLQGLFSVVPPEALDRVDLHAGGFGAEWGDRMSGVLDLTAIAPSERELAFGASFVTAQALAGGGGERGRSWLISARRGYLDWILDFVDPGGTFRPSYADAFAKLVQPLHGRHVLATQVLGLADEERYESDEPGEELLDGEQRSFDAWVTWSAAWGRRWTSRATAAWGDSSRDRRGFVADGDSRERDARDRRSTTVELAVERGGERARTSFGARHRSLDAQYDHFHVRAVELSPTAPPAVETFAARVGEAGDQLGLFASQRWRLGAASAVEFGLRWDRQSWTGEEQWSPRAAWVWALGERTTLRGSWGVYHQPLRVDELAIEDGDLTLYPAEGAELAAFGLDHRTARGWRWRIEAFARQVDDPRPRYENLFDPIELFPGLESDRVRIAPELARARGVELAVRQPLGDRFGGSLVYTWSRAEDRVDGAWQPRAWDQPHAAALELEARLGREWRLRLAAIFHAGWPTTRLELVPGANPDGSPGLVPELGERNAERFGDYVRVDARIGRTYRRARSELDVYFDAFNLLARDNPCCVDDFDLVPQGDGSFLARPNIESWLPFVPSFGLTWRRR